VFKIESLTIVNKITMRPKLILIDHQLIFRQKVLVDD
jgi:hypothetical protein